MSLPYIPSCFPIEDHKSLYSIIIPPDALPSLAVQEAREKRRKVLEALERTRKANYERFLQRMASLEKTQREKNRRLLERYANICRTLRPVRKDIGDIDNLIAATALEHDLTLLTIDSDFQRVPHLKTNLVDLKKAA